MRKPSMAIDFDWFVGDTILSLETGETKIVGFASAVKRAEKAGINPEYAATFLIGLQACDAWYKKNRVAYSHLKNLTEGNSGNAPKNAALVDERESLNAASFYERQVLIVLGFMRLCGAKTVSKKHLAPFTNQLKKFFPRKNNQDNGDLPLARIYRNLNQRGNRLRGTCDKKFRRKRGRDRGMLMGRRLFLEIHTEIKGMTKFLFLICRYFNFFNSHGVSFTFGFAKKNKKRKN